LGTLLKMKHLGVSRIGTSSTQAILEECRSVLHLAPLNNRETEANQGY